MQRETKGIELQLQMAQAARLNLRMQKELKLLLSDPPPGASFPSLSNSDHHHFSLTSIDTVIQGPEGTVYSNGLFKIKIQIPERYPFQPPMVTFATPIYHPNIDNGGRICLDILNLPPKGMWQPSLNISTVLTSIGLLLSEPNPDDGLMHEASRDYKYNRQAFDFNARSMTEKYAQAGVTDIARGEYEVQTHTSGSTSQTEKEGSVALAPRCTSKHKKLSLDSQGCCNNGRDSAEEFCKVPIHSSSKNHTGIGPLKEDSKNLFKYTGNSGKLNTGTGRYKMSLKVPVPSHGESGKDSMSNQGLLSEIQTPSDSPECSLVQAGNIASMKDEGHVERSHSASVGKGLQSLHRVRSNLCRESDEKSQSTPQITVSPIGSARPQIGRLPSHNHTVHTHSKANPPEDAIARKGYCSTSISLKKRGLVGVMPSPKPLGLPKNRLIEDKENMAPFRSVSPQLTGQAAVFIPESVICCNETEKKAVTEAPKLYEKAVELPVEPLNQLRGSNEIVIMHPENLSSPHLKCLHPANDVRSGMKQLAVEVCDEKHAVTLPAPDAVIVLDSEDSDDENIPVRSKLSLARRCLSRKRKSGC